MNKNKKALVWIIIALTASAPVRAEGAGKLIDLVPGLHGGDGIFLATAPAASHTAHFSIESVAAINRLNQQIAAEVGGFPFSSSVGGFSFEFDPATGGFVSTTRTMGPLIAERAITQGRKHLNFNLSYTYLKYNKFSGRSLNNFGVTARHDTHIVGFPDVREQFEHDFLQIDLDLDIRVQILALSTTYGVLDRLDVGFLLPFAHVNMDVLSRAQVVEAVENTLFPNIHSFEGGPEPATDRAEGSANGLGDLVLRAKYHLLKGEGMQVAGAALLQLGTADRDDFLGTGESAFRPFLIFSQSFGNVTPHLNIGYEFNLDQGARSAFEYAFGFDAGNNKYTFAGELLGSHELDGDGIGDDIVDTAWGVKWNPSSRWLLGLNTRFSLNDAGLRSTVTTTVSVEYGF